MDIAPAPLEEWMRKYYFTTEIDIGSSGVENFSVGDLRSLLDITQEEMDDVILHDSSSYGNLSLRDAIARRWGNGNPEWVMATHGSSEGIFLTMSTLLSPGDKVVVVAPCYHSLASIAVSMGCTLKRWELSAAQNFRPNMEDLQHLIDSDTRMVIVNFPHNPTGITLSVREQELLISAVANVGAYLVWDAAFADLTYDEPPLPDPTLRYERAISISTFSKAYGLPGLRFGWCLAAPDILAKFVHLRDRTTLHLSPLVEFIAKRVVDHAPRLLSPRLQQARANRDVLAAWVDQFHEYVDWVPPQGGVTAFPRFPRVCDIEAFCHDLANNHRVLLVPGTCFNIPSRVRLGFGGATAELVEGLSRLTSLLVTVDT